MENIITIKNLSYSYQNTTKALEDIDLDIQKGEWISIVGHNGSGKSTLSKLIVGLLNKQSGDIIVDGITLSEETIYDIRSKIGIVFQNPDNQFVGATVQDDIAFGLENRGVERTEMVRRIEEFSKKVNMEEFLQREPHLLSGGQKQRVAIAGVLAMHPEIIILDEATSMLDPKGRQEIIQTIRRLYENEQITIISITHDLEEAAMSDRIVVLNKGKIEQIDVPKNVFKNEKRLIEIGLDIPFSIKVSNALNLDIALNKEELVNILCK